MEKGRLWGPARIITVRTTRMRIKFGRSSLYSPRGGAHKIFKQTRSLSTRLSYNNWTWNKGRIRTRECIITLRYSFRRGYSPYPPSQAVRTSIRIAQFCERWAVSTTTPCLGTAWSFTKLAPVHPAEMRLWEVQGINNENSLLKLIAGPAYGSPPSRIVVSAPRGTAPRGVPNTGLIYSCPVNPGSCSALPGKLYDTTREL